MSTVCRVCLSGNVRLYYIENIRVLDVYEKLTNIMFYSPDERPDRICCVCYRQLQKCIQFSDMAQKAESILTYLSQKDIEATHENVLEMNIKIKDELTVSPLEVIDYTNNTDKTTIKKCSLSVKEATNNEAQELISIEKEDIEWDQSIEDATEEKQLQEQSTVGNETELKSVEENEITSEIMLLHDTIFVEKEELEWKPEKPIPVGGKTAKQLKDRISIEEGLADDLLIDTLIPAKKGNIKNKIVNFLKFEDSDTDSDIDSDSNDVKGSHYQESLDEPDDVNMNRDNRNLKFYDTDSNDVNVNHDKRSLNEPDDVNMKTDISNAKFDDNDSNHLEGSHYQKRLDEPDDVNMNTDNRTFKFDDNNSNDVEESHYQKSLDETGDVNLKFQDDVNMNTDNRNLKFQECANNVVEVSDDQKRLDKPDNDKFEHSDNCVIRYIYVNTDKRNALNCCEFCSAPFNSKRLLNKHIKTHHSTIDHRPCKICNKVFHDKFELELHNITHYGERKKRDEFSNAPFNSKGQPNGHIKTQHGMKEPVPLHCQKCKEVFYDESELKSHNITHYVGRQRRDYCKSKIEKKNKEQRCMLVIKCRDKTR